MAAVFLALKSNNGSSNRTSKYNNGSKPAENGASHRYDDFCDTWLIWLE
jgi:hypothetical protein